MKRNLIIWLLIAHLLKELVWMIVIPIWHFPDEEQHFGQVAFWAEKKLFPQGREKDINTEIDQSSLILGTKRDGRGINDFTYHPEYRILYSESQTGIFENDIKILNTKDLRQEMVKQEASRYGPIYYFLAGIGYKFFFEKDLFIRVFSGRFISIILSSLTIIIVYLISKKIFKNELLRISLPLMVAFQPMFSFVSSGINSDNLFNLIFTLILYSLILLFFDNNKNNIIKNKFYPVIILIGSLIAGFYTKKQYVIAFPIIILAFAMSLTIKKRVKFLSFMILTIVFILYFIKINGRIVIPEYNPFGQSKLNESFIVYIYWHLRHTISETIPWYWGVFNWLGVTLPSWVLKIQARLLILSALGFLVYIIRQMRQKMIFNSKNLMVFFLIFASGIYFFSIISWDYFFRQTQGFSFGIQGRYFFPTIISHMLFIILGLTNLIPKKFVNIFIKLFICWWLIFSLIGLFTAIKAYYIIWPLKILINQISQYKPAIFKGSGFVIIFILFAISKITLFIKLIKTNAGNIKENN